jgi:3-carboxy-cis,cis-muconate cycloisomerase
MTHLIDSLATTDALAVLFADQTQLQALLDVEAALACVQADLGLIPQRASAVIAEAARADGFDAAAIARDARSSGTIIVPLVKALTERVRAIDEDSAKFVHWGATSQDIADTALARTVIHARTLLDGDRRRLVAALRSLSDTHASTVMLGRTLLQPAAPTTFGLKAAGWHAATERSWARLAAAFDEAAILQLGGAAGTAATICRAAATRSGTASMRLGRIIVSGPGQYFSTNRRIVGSAAPLSGVVKFSIQEAEGTWQINGSKNGRSFASKIRATAVAFRASAARP